METRGEGNVDDLSSFPTGRTVPFPYDHPYPQQIDLMDTMLRSLREQPRDSGDGASASSCCPVWMLESPTGTGKSLSLACASMAWLRHVENEDLENKTSDGKDEEASTAGGGLDWINAWVPPEQREREDQQKQVREKAKEARKTLSQELVSIQTKFRDQDTVRQRAKRENLVRSAITSAKLAERKANKRKRQRRQRISNQPDSTNDFCLDDYRSDDGGKNCSDGDDSDTDEKRKENYYAHSAAAALLNGPSLDGSSVGDHTYATARVQPGSGVRKIVYAARTHSQLSQFVGELRRTAWGSNVRVVALGGRKALCGNHSLKGKSEAFINESCLDLQKNNKSSQTGKRSATTTAGGGCPLLACRGAVDTLALHVLAQPTDIEEAANLGDTAQTCAYYASRRALAAAEVVVLPYSMLLSKQTRTAIGLSLKEALVIVDEAHNLPEALRSLHSCRLSLPVVQAALDQLGAYTAKYANRLAGRNLHYLGQIRRILLAFRQHLTKPDDKREHRMMAPGELLIEHKLDNINLFRILRYLERSRLAQKLLGFTNHNNSNSSEPQTDGLSKHVSAMSVVQTFLEKLTFSGKEGKVVVDWPSVDALDSRSRIQNATLRYVLLHPAAFFENVLKEARALALVGGTLRPFVHVAAELLGDYDDAVLVEAARADSSMQSSTQISNSFVSPAFTAFTCDHVVSSSNVLLQCLGKGPTGQSLDFRHHARSTGAVCDELGATLVQICRTVPSGIVVFLPSYSYEASLVRHWKKSGVWQDLQHIKKIHREPKSSQQVDAALQSYARGAPKGALLFSVVGGKMSEGINFSNEMARCVVVVGLPYPDITDPELKEKMATMDNAAEKTITGQAYYQNLCMRAVNQSVGRAIRHANDYAAIVLADIRYQTDNRIWSGLPNWLKKGASPDCRRQVPLERRRQEMKAFFDGHS